MTLSPSVLAAFRADALARWPEEACGLVTEAGYLACENLAADPRIDFRIADADWLAAGAVEAVMHSHTHRRGKDGGLEARPIDAPSLADQIAQPATGVPWGIACVTRDAAGEIKVTDTFFFGDEVEPPPLIGRPFRWGVTDCFALARDWYRARGILVANVPRERGWEATADLFRDNFAAAGFVPVSSADPREGDVPLMRVHSDKPNHCGVYVGNGLMLHHQLGCLSGRHPVSRYAGQITHWLRHRDFAC